MSKTAQKSDKKFSKAAFLLSSAAACAIAVGILAGAKSGFWAEQKEGLVYISQEISLSFGLRLKEVLLKGRHRTKKSDMLAAMNVDRGMPILAVDLQKAQKALEALPWVKTARIERRLPHILYIDVTEHTPIAVWQHKGKYNPVNEDGGIVHADVTDLKGLPLIVGDNAPAKTPALLEMLKQEPALFARVRAATYMSNRRWDVVLDSVDNGIVIRLPDKNPQNEWSRLEKLNRTHGLLKRTVTMVDLRFPDKVVVQFEKPKKAKEKTLSMEIKKETDI